MRQKWDRELLGRLVEVVPEDEPDQILWICLEYEYRRGVRIEKSTIKDLIRRGRIPQGKLDTSTAPVYPIQVNVLREIIHDDPWIIAYAWRCYKQYRKRVGTPCCADATLSRWLRKYGVEAAMESPHWDPDVLDLIQERSHDGYVIPEKVLNSE